MKSLVILHATHNKVGKGNRIHVPMKVIPLESEYKMGMTLSGVKKLGYYFEAPSP
jgi:hypothetical protein